MAPKPFRVEAVLPAPAPTYFLERDSAAFRSLLSKVLKIGQLEFNDLWHEGASTFVRMVTKPEFGSWVPKSVAGQLQSSNLEFHDIIEYNPAHIATPPYKIFVRTESPFLKDKLDIQLTLTIEEVEPGTSSRQILEGHIRVKMFGVGRIVEGIVKDSLINTYKKLPEIVRRWQLFREEALRSGDGRQLLLGRPPVGCEVSWIRREVLQILKEPLPEEPDGTASPVSPLCPVAGASEASEDSPAVQARARQRATAAAATARQQYHQQQQLQYHQQLAEAEAESVFAAAAAGALEQQQAATASAVAAAAQQQKGQPSREQAILEEPLLEEEVQQGRRHSAAITEYYDAREVCCPGEEEVMSQAPPADQGVQEGEAAAVAAPSQQPQQPVPEAGEGPSFMPVNPRAAEAAALPPLQPQRSSLAALAAAALARGAHHRRTLSSDSATSTDTPTTEGGVQAQAPGNRRFWRRFNRNYQEWDVYWDQVGVEQEVEEAEEQEAAAGGSGGIVARALYAVEEVMRDSYYSTSILVALFLMRRGWLRVEPDANAPTHDEEHRHHEGHRHRRTSSSGGASVASEPHSSLLAAGAGAGARPQPQSLARVAQEVCSRMVSAPRKAVVAAGSSVRQAGITGAKVIFSPSSKPRNGADGSSSSSSHGTVASGSAVQRGSPAGNAGAAAAGDANPVLNRHRKTVSLDTGTALAAREAAAAALLQQRHGSGGAGAGPEQGAPAVPPLPPGWSPKNPLERRPSDLASAAAMASMQRSEHRVRARSRLSCFAGCRAPPAVKD